MIMSLELAKIARTRRKNNKELKVAAMMLMTELKRSNSEQEPTGAAESAAGFAALCWIGPARARCGAGEPDARPQCACADAGDQHAATRAR